MTANSVQTPKLKYDYSIRLCLELELKEWATAIVETASYESMLS